MYENRVTISHAPGPPWKTGRSGDRGPGDDVADRTHERKTGEEHNQARGDRYRRFEVQPELGAERVQQDRGRGRDGAAHCVLKEEGQSVPVEHPVDTVDRHGTQRADQTDQPSRAQGSRRRVIARSSRIGLQDQDPIP